MKKRTLISCAFLLALLTVTVFAQDADWTDKAPAKVEENVSIELDPTKQYQEILGFGTCQKTWGKPEKDPVIAGQYNDELLKEYAQDAGMSIVRIPLSKWVYEGENPYGVKAAATQEGMKDPTKISYEDFLWETDHGRADTHTTIEELHAWELDGPFLDDFLGKRRQFPESAPGAIGDLK